MEVLIGVGLGVGGIVIVVVVGYLLNKRLFNDLDAEREDRKKAEVDAKAEDERNDILESNVLALKTEIAAVKQKNDLLTAQLGAVERSADDLRHAIETSQPSALPVAVRAELDRLRQKATVSPDPKAAATGDPDRREGDPVHEADASDKPTG